MWPDSLKVVSLILLLPLVLMVRIVEKYLSWSKLLVSPCYVDLPSVWYLLDSMTKETVVVVEIPSVVQDVSVLDSDI